MRRLHSYGLPDRSEDAAAQGITRRELIQFEAVCEDFRLAKHTLAQVLNKVIRVDGVSLATAIADKRPTGGCERDERTLIALFKLMGLRSVLPFPDETL